MKFQKINESIENNINYNFKDDLNIIKNVLNLDNNKLSAKCGCSVADIKNIENGNVPNRTVADKIYGYAYSEDVYINDILWEEYVDEYGDDNYLILTHGSRSGLYGNIRLDINSESNDFANGFYCGQSIKQAGMFVSESPESSIYLIGFDGRGLKRAEFFVSTPWMLAVAYYRNKLGNLVNHSKILELVNYVENADYVVAPIADNQIFEVIDAFANEELTDKQARIALSATHLGKQYVFKKDTCIPHLKVLRRCYMCPMEKTNYTYSSNKEWRTSMNKSIIAKNRFKDEGKYISEILN